MLSERVEAVEAALAALEESPLQEDARKTLEIAADYVGRAELLIASAALSEALTAAEIDGEERERLLARVNDG